ncbi:hypothetical protein A1O1_05618 [Capronia coronata CBS 617.96]|uniref:Uncharacterized protein n=1 Tax=Capronia coronata CBS 617.96 TaxID=1182541 RepID=W9Y761_9EURO|nr:uncharacterized protein A1O1_05618 [Capronia coronata CBS 617.96]EXJ88687.1 hypothetical protein A1O1_05618 [Capronia coronata CBS 617.96]
MLFPWQRDVRSCPPGQNYYGCSAVSYAGCCAHDPCGSGVCIDAPFASTPGSCGGRQTVTVTETILHGAATSTVDPSNSAFLTSTTGDAGAATTTTDSYSLVSSSSFSGSGSITVTGPSTWADAVQPLTSDVVPTSIPAVSSTTVTNSAATTKTLSLVVASPSLKPTTSPCPTPGISKPKPPPPGTIAGSVVGSMAGLALIILLLTWCMRRKRKVKFTFKRKSKNPDQERNSEDVESKPEPSVAALWTAEQNKPLPSPRSFDFGLPRIPQNSTALMPKQWI